MIGAGAAGLMAAIEAGRRGLKVLIIEKSQKPAEKIRISGGGRCNFTNINASPENYISSNPHFAKSALSQYTPGDFIILVEKHKIKYHEKKLGQLFCDKDSHEIINMLLDEAKSVGAELLTGIDVESMACDQTASSHQEDNVSYRFKLKSKNQEWQSKSLIIASGGLSIPKMGATDFAYKIAKQFGINIIPTRPALVPFCTGGKLLKLCEKLSGLSVDTLISIKSNSNHRPSFRENMLFTHKGLSGPAILQISSYWKEGEEIKINFLPDLDLLSLLKDLTRDPAYNKKQIRTILLDLKNIVGDNEEQLSDDFKQERFHLPEKFVDEFLAEFNLSQKLAETSFADLELISGRLQAWTLIPSGTEGFAKAEVTVGGIDTSELSSKTMESKKIPGLYFIGECVDVTGWLGGYNFQWAWASGYLAGRNV